MILAAGCSSRLGKAKQLVEYDGLPLICRQIELALQYSTDVTVVLGYQSHEISIKIASYPVDIIVNEQWQKGLGSTISYAVSQRKDADYLMLMLVDQWQLTSSDLERLISTYQQAPSKIIASSWLNKQNNKQAFGPPVIFPARFFTKLIRLKGEQGAKPIISENLSEVVFVELPSAGADLDTPEQLELMSQYKK